MPPSLSAKRFIRSLRKTLFDRGNRDAHLLFDAMVLRAKADGGYGAEFVCFAEVPSTVALREISRPFGDYWKDLEFANRIDEIDAAMLPAKARLAATPRSLDGRIFPAIEIGGGWSLSLQGDSAGYACRPRERLATLEEYDLLEGVIYGPGGETVDPARLGLPFAVRTKFTDARDDGPSIGTHLDWSDIHEIRISLEQARRVGLAPAGEAPAPDGRYTWILAGNNRCGEFMSAHASRAAALDEISEILGFEDEDIAEDSPEYWTWAEARLAATSVSLNFGKLDKKTNEIVDEWRQSAVEPEPAGQDPAP
ncbi:hypothetical protein [Defluviimonas salinarum]|uniref:Uncharacterized protein n=1 Tax=Defluviimonas salinarum TaxID=2992147 RepID=A0ABT3J6D1_9RHOB|nr:hypothetical protein [Defluviimonas salinarum]MCW3783010.1 hypothetical protein [Defluviimonas salinarum]